MHDIDVTRMDIEEHLLWLVEIGVETCAFFLAPVRWKRKAVHHSRQPIELDVFFVDVEQESILEHVFWCAFEVFARVHHFCRDVVEVFELFPIELCGSFED